MLSCSYKPSCSPLIPSLETVENLDIILPWARGVQNFAADLGDLLRVRKPASAAYAALTAAYLGAGAAYLALPAEVLVHTFSVPACPLVTLPDWVFLWRCLGASLLVLPTWTFSLKARSSSGNNTPAYFPICMHAGSAPFPQLVVSCLSL